MKISRIGLALIAGTLSIASVAIAGDESNNVEINATVADTCTISGGTLSFPDYNTLDPDDDLGDVTLQVRCTSGAVSTISLDQGLHDTAGTPDAPQRLLDDGAGHSLSYDLFSDAGRSTEWSVNGNAVAYNAVNSQPTDETIYGSITAGQDVPKGVYTDTVIATVSF